MIRGIKRLIFCWILLHVFSVCFAPAARDGEPRFSQKNEDKSCTTPENKPGVCIGYENCKKLHDLVATNQFVRNSHTESLIRNSKCGWKNNVPLICCSESDSEEVTPVTISSTGLVSPEARFTKQTKPTECGKLAKNGVRILGGRPAELGSWPWIVALGYRKWSDPSIHFRCGGSLISDQWILTAAHCVTDLKSFELTLVRVGDLDLDANVKDDASPIDLPLEATTVHPLYTRDRRNYDIALIRLKNQIKFTPLIQPICLLSGSTYEMDEYYKRKSPYVAGWGVNETGGSPTRLYEVSVNIVDFSNCIEKYRNVDQVVSLTDNILCAGSPGKDSCQGDSGGPLIFINTSEVRYYLGGVVSAGKGCGTAYPGLYMRVAKFIDWINKSTGLNF